MMFLGNGGGSDDVISPAQRVVITAPKTQPSVPWVLVGALALMVYLSSRRS